MSGAKMATAVLVSFLSVVPLLRAAPDAGGIDVEQEHISTSKPAQPAEWPPSDTFRPGNGVALPRVVREAKPRYTADAMRAKVQGSVLLECIVETDGRVNRIHIARSLDPTFGLDQEAVKAAEQWRFTPGTKNGMPVPVLVTIELTFMLRDTPPETSAVGAPAPPQCRHNANESQTEQERRRDALVAARIINTLQANQPGARAGRYLDIAGLQAAAADKPLLVRIPLLFIPDAELLPGFALKLGITESGYWFMIKDKTDPCGFAYVSNEQGVIYRSEPIQ